MDLSFPNRYSLFIAKDRDTRLHSAIWVIKDPQGEPPASAITVDMYNALMYAKNPETLLDAMEAIGPLRCAGEPSTEEGYSTQRMPVGEFLALFRKKFGESDERSLRRETFLHPFLHTPKSEVEALGPEADVYMFSPDGNARATGRAVERRDARANGLDAMLTGLVGREDYAVCIESLQEWLFSRNMLSIASQLYVSMDRNPDRPLSSAGSFTYVEDNKILKRPCFVTPLIFNTFWKDDSIWPRLKDGLTGAYKLINPFQDSVTEASSGHKRLGRLATVHYYRCLKDFDDFIIMTPPQALGRKGAAASKEPGTESLRLFAVLPVGTDEREADVAKRAFAAIHHAVFAGPKGAWLDVLGGSAADEYDEHLGDSKLGYGSTLGALWGRMLHHRGHKLVTCQKCHNTVLFSAKAARTKYCSSSCRTSATRKSSK